MPIEERRARHEVLYAKVCEYDLNRWQREFLTALRGARFQCSNGELANLETSGARVAPIDQLAEVREQEPQAALSARRRRATRRAVIKGEA